MEVIRQFYEDAPISIAVPESLRHKRLEVILLLQESTGKRGDWRLEVSACRHAKRR